MTTRYDLIAHLVVMHDYAPHAFTYRGLLALKRTHVEDHEDEIEASLVTETLSFYPHRHELDADGWPVIDLTPAERKAT